MASKTWQLLNAIQCAPEATIEEFTQNVQIGGHDFERLVLRLGNDVGRFSGLKIENLSDVKKMMLDCANAKSFSFTTLEARLCIIDALIAELQTARLLHRRRQTDEGRDAKSSSPRLENNTKPAEDLKNILKSLGFSRPPDNIEAGILFEKLIAKTTTKIASLPPAYVKSVIHAPLVDGAQLTPAQWTQMDKLNQAMIHEYHMRAELLVKRLDVTMQSFSWSERTKSLQHQISAKYGPLREEIRHPSQIRVSHILAARRDLARVLKASSSALCTKSRVNAVLLQGQVPDRGGRTTEMNAPAKEMPKWQKERAQGGASPRGGGGWSRGSPRGRGGNSTPKRNASPRNRNYESPASTMFGTPNSNYSPQFQAQSPRGGFQSPRGAFQSPRGRGGDQRGRGWSRGGRGGQS